MRIQDAYEKIRSSYSEKKQMAWKELIELYPSLSQSKDGIVIDVGAGNGRNLQMCTRTLVVALDITRALLEDYVADDTHQRIEGSLPHLPFRRCAGDEVLSIAVIHHLRSKVLREQAINEMVRITDGLFIFTVWRKWRPSNAKKILGLIRKGLDPSVYIDHERPWKNSGGKVIAHRFYHYFTMKELVLLLSSLQYQIIKMGGKSKVDNYFIEVISKCRNHSLLN